MTGESLINGTYDIMTKRVAQGTASGLDQFFNAGIREILAAVVIIIFCYALYRSYVKRR